MEDNVVQEPPKEPKTTVKIYTRLVDKLYVAKGRSGEYSAVIEDWMKKAEAYDLLYEQTKKQAEGIAEAQKSVRAQLTKIKGLVKKMGSPELQAAVNEVFKENE